MNNTNNVVLITGASSGFGRLIAELLSKSNFQVIATMRDISGKNSKIIDHSILPSGIVLRL